MPLWRTIQAHKNALNNMAPALTYGARSGRSVFIQFKTRLISTAAAFDQPARSLNTCAVANLFTLKAGKFAPAAVRHDLINRKIWRQMGHYVEPPCEGSYLLREYVVDKVLQILERVDKIPKDKLTPIVSFKELGLDSLDQVELMIIVENEFAIDLEDVEASEITTVAELIDTIADHPFAQ